MRFHILINENLRALFHVGFPKCWQSGLYPPSKRLEDSSLRNLSRQEKKIQGHDVKYSSSSESAPADDATVTLTVDKTQSCTKCFQVGS